MSQYLVGVFNNTNQSISIWNSESSGNQGTIPAGWMMVIQGGAGHWNIPDCSAVGYFPGHHMEIRPNPNGQAILSFWDDDATGYVIQTCPGTNYADMSLAPGASQQGNGANVVIQVNNIGTGMGIFVIAAQTAGS